MLHHEAPGRRRRRCRQPPLDIGNVGKVPHHNPSWMSTTERSCRRHSIILGASRHHNGDVFFDSTTSRHHHQHQRTQLVAFSSSPSLQPQKEDSDSGLADNNDDDGTPLVDHDSFTMEDASQQRQQRERLAAARAIPYWLGQDRAWRERTMELLELPTTTNTYTTAKASSSSSSSSDQSRNDYNHLYYDSLASFDDYLQHTPYENLPLDLQRTLDGLVQLGLADSTFFQRYRAYPDHEARLRAKASQIVAQRSYVGAQEKENQGIKQELASLQQEFDNLAAQVQELEAQERAAKMADSQQKAQESS